MIIPQNIEYVLLGFVLDFCFNLLIILFGINLILQSHKQEGQVQEQYSIGIGLFFISIASSALVYGIDLANRTFFGSRIFPAKVEYEQMGYIFDSMHVESYFILILVFLAISLAALMFPIEKHIVQRKKIVFTKLNIIAAPIPIIIRILELLTLPKVGTPLYYLFYALFLFVWFSVIFSMLMVIGIYINISLKSAGEIRKKAIAIVINMVLWLLLHLRRQNILKGIDDEPMTFWVVPVAEMIIFLLFVYGFSEMIQTSETSLKEIRWYQHWFSKTFIGGFSVALIVYFSILFWLFDLDLVIFWTTQAQANPTLNNFGEFIDQSAFEGHGFGGQDITFLFLIPCVLLYFLSFAPKLEEKLGKSRIYTGFVLASSIIVALVNRAFKGFFGRVRPLDAIKNPDLYSRIFEWGQYSLSKGLSSGSFTSGHTTTAAILITIAFLLLKTRKSWVIVLGFIVTIGWTIIMGFGRVVHGAHYPGDTLWALVISFILITLIYFNIFKIPQQESGEFKPKMKAYAFIWSIFASIFIIGLFLFGIGIKYSILEFQWYWPVISAVSVPICYLFVTFMKKSLLI